jgi:hypothetical protein
MYMMYLIRGCSGPEDEVPWEVCPREVESSSCHPSLPRRHHQQQLQQQEEDEPASTRKGLHLSLRSYEMRLRAYQLKFVCCVYSLLPLLPHLIYELSV